MEDNVKDQLIKYNDLGNKISEYTHFIVWSGSKEDKINNWLNPIYHYAKDKSKFYRISDERDCGWYIEKDKILFLLHDKMPVIKDEILQHEISLILNELWDFIIDYKEPQRT